MNFPERLNFLINQIGITKKAFAIQCDISREWRHVSPKGTF
jgi:hypothetical protein